MIPQQGKTEASKPKEFLRAFWYGLAQLVCQVGLIALYGIRVYGSGNVPKKGGVVIASNHQSYFDPVLIGVGLRRPIHSMARESLFRNPLFGWLIRSLNAFPVRRGKLDVRAVREAIRRVRAGHVMLLFPEGTRTRDGEIGSLRGGVGLVSRRARVPIVPAVIYGAFEAWPRHRSFPRLHPIRVAFGKAIAPSEQEKLGEKKLSLLIARAMGELQKFLAGSMIRRKS